jgi:hypothetical protein
MRKYLYLGMALVLTAVLFIVISFNNRNAASSPEIIRGDVALVDENMLIIKEDKTQMEYELIAPTDKLKEVKTGYRVEVKADNERVSSLTILGMSQSEAELHEKWNKVINTNSVF